MGLSGYPKKIRKQIPQLAATAHANFLLRGHLFTVFYPGMKYRMTYMKL